MIPMGELVGYSSKSNMIRQQNWLYRTKEKRKKKHTIGDILTRVGRASVHVLTHNHWTLY